jgi:hypothetical protein
MFTVIIILLIAGIVYFLFDIIIAILGGIWELLFGDFL